MMEGPQRRAATDGDPSTTRGDDNHDETATELQRRARRAEEAMEEMLLAQEAREQEQVEEQEAEVAEGRAGNRIFNDIRDGGRRMEENEQDFIVDDDEHDGIPFLDDETINNETNFDQPHEKNNPFTYVRVSFWAAILLLYYAFRSRQQWYLALVFLSSSKYAYVILGNALVASLIWFFQLVTRFFMNGLRLHEAEGLGDFFRWHITETCLALTIFRSELNVKTGILFLVLVFAKCLHWVVDMREGHLRMTEEVVVVNPTTGWIGLRYPHVKLLA